MQTTIAYNEQEIKGKGSKEDIMPTENIGKRNYENMGSRGQD
jgi:hypothetical protein